MTRDPLGQKEKEEKDGRGGLIQGLTFLDISVVRLEVSGGPPESK